MKKLLTLFLALSFLLASCGQETKKTNLKQQEGIIVNIQEHSDEVNRMLVVPNIIEEDISNKNLEELTILAQEKSGAYYFFEKGSYEELDVGARVIVYWNGTQLDSNPPQRGAKKVDKLSK